MSHRLSHNSARLILSVILDYPYTWNYIGGLSQSDAISNNLLMTGFVRSVKGTKKLCANCVFVDVAKYLARSRALQREILGSVTRQFGCKLN